MIAERFIAETKASTSNPVTTNSSSKEKHRAAVVYLWVVLVAENVQSTVSRDPEYLLSSPALCRGVWDKQHSGALHTLEATPYINTTKWERIEGKLAINHQIHFQICFTLWQTKVNPKFSLNLQPKS